MLYKAISIWVLVSVFCLTIASPVSAQQAKTKQEKKTEKIREKIQKLGVGENVKIKVELHNDTTYQGYLSQVNDENFLVVDKAGNPNTINYSDVNKVGGKNLSTGAKIAIGIGIGVGATLLTLYLIFISLDS